MHKHFPYNELYAIITRDQITFMLHVEVIDKIVCNQIVNVIIIYVTTTYSILFFNNKVHLVNEFAGNIFSIIFNQTISISKETFFLPLGFNPDVLYAFGAGADAVDFFSCRLPNVYAGDRILFDSLIVTSKMEVIS